MGNNKTKTILLINSFGFGGAERQFSILAQQDLFDEIYCLETDNTFLSGKKINFLSKHTSKTSSIYKYLYLLVYTFRLYKHLRNSKSEIKVIAVMERSFAVAFALSFFLKISYYFSFQLSYSSHHKGLNLKMYNFFIRLISKNAAKLIPNSVALANELAASFPEYRKKIVPILNGYDFNEVLSRANAEYELHPLFETKYLLCVARFFEQKAQDKLIAAYAELRAKHPEIKLVFAGTGYKMDECIQLAVDLNLRTYVHGRDPFSLQCDVYFLGFQTNPLVLMKNAFIFTFPTHYEGLPNALIEAMICGSIPISSDCPTGPREILAPDSKITDVTNSYEIADYGVLVAPFTIADASHYWLVALEELIDNKALYSEIERKIPEGIERYKISNIIKIWKENLL